MCTECGQRRVVRRTSQQPWSKGEIFYCCPRHKHDGSGCPFLYWKRDYMELDGVRGHGTGLMQVAESRLQRIDSKMMEGDGFVTGKKEQELLGVGKEVVSLLKTIRCLCVWEKNSMQPCCKLPSVQPCSL
ncbi:hypothetical protein HU200_002779 [Digitaria exilis]|uniref:GRF-type domain-containing protein n=1 Tax=Digitaria exilis TaxID=1010633 RepID=A0A835FXE3_9POAL|nr:hypothetical protein HU200_002779 [Digitaria exilis]